MLDSGALLALERNDRNSWRRLKDTWALGELAVTHAGVLGQVWRGRGSRQALLARAVQGVHVLPLDEKLARAAGELLGGAGLDDVIEAALVLLATNGDTLSTSDPLDIGLLAAAAQVTIDIVSP